MGIEQQKNNAPELGELGKLSSSSKDKALQNEGLDRKQYGDDKHSAGKFEDKDSNAKFEGSNEGTFEKSQADVPKGKFEGKTESTNDSNVGKFEGKTESTQGQGLGKFEGDSTGNSKDKSNLGKFEGKFEGDHTQLGKFESKDKK